MPNWVENEVTITGDNKILTDIREKYFTEYEDGTIKFDLNKVIPMPEELSSVSSPNYINGDKMIEKYGVSDWYEWRLANWGVKWNTYPYGDTVVKGNKLLFQFNSPWGVPSPVFVKLTTLYPNIVIENYVVEESGFFKGNIVYKNGTVDDSDLEPYDNSEDEDDDEDDDE